jgi:putative YhdH/YhfP family quinone oxidoreductase
MAIPKKFSSFRINKDEDGYHAGVKKISLDDLNAGDVTIRVAWSGVNYKDALAGTGKGQILRTFPLTGGIDVAGTVIESESDRFVPGDAVLTTGCNLSETRDGGYSEYLRLDSNWVVALPEGLTLREAMGLGTAGFTAALSLWHMEINGQTPAAGPIVVTGASGGVGSIAVDLLTTAGYEVHAISGKLDQWEYLESLGARQCISSKELYWGEGLLEKTRWAGAIDNIGGDMLNGLTRVIKPFGNIASCGMAGGIGLNTSVMPFIIRGIKLLGINSAMTPMDVRKSIWERLAGQWKPTQLDKIIQSETDLEGLPEAFQRMLDFSCVELAILKLQGLGHSNGEHQWRLF